MEAKLNKFKNNFVFKDEIDKSTIKDLIVEIGLDKCFEILKNFKNLKKVKDNVNPKEYVEFAFYEFSLSTVLFTLLRREENNVKGFLCNIRGGCKIKIEEKASAFARTKYYFKFPDRKGDYIRIRTHVYKFGKVNYYDAVKTLDFGDINLLFSHLTKKEIEMYSTDKNIVSDLDKSRKLRNYVYHHNLLFSLGKDELISEIKNVLNTVNDIDIKEYFIKKINTIREKENLILLDDELVVNI